MRKDPSTKMVLAASAGGRSRPQACGVVKNVEAVVGTSTWLPLGDSNADAVADGALDRPVSLHHGYAVEVVRTSWGLASKERLEELGCSVSFATYPGMAHSACPEEFGAISSFLKSSL